MKIRLTFFLLCLLLFGCKTPSGYILKIWLPDKGTVLRQYPVCGGDRFVLEYIHSSEKTPIRDFFEITEEGELVLLEERYQWYAVGLEANTEGRGLGMHYDGKETVVTLNRPFPVLPVRVGWVAEQVLILPGERILLSEIASGGELLEIRIIDKRRYPWRRE